MSFEASEEEKRELEYATQFFDFTPDSYADTISFTATDIIDEELNQFRARIKEEFPGKMSDRELDDCFNIIKDQYNESAVKILNKLSEYLKKNILRVPRHIVLPEDKAHVDHKFTGDDLENALKTIDSLCTKIKNTKYKKAVLQAKLANLRKVALRQENLLAEINHLAELKYQTEALLDSQMNILEDKIRSQRPLLQALECDADENSLNAENVDNVKSELDAKKRRNVFADSIVDKKFRDDSDDSDNDK